MPEGKQFGSGRPPDRPTQKEAGFKPKDASVPAWNAQVSKRSEQGQPASARRFASGRSDAGKRKVADLRTDTDIDRAMNRTPTDILSNLERSLVKKEQLAALRRETAQRTKAREKQEKPSGGGLLKKLGQALKDADSGRPAKPAEQKFSAAKTGERAATGTKEARERQLSATEKAERTRVARPAGGVGFHYNSTLPAAGHMDQLMSEISPQQREGIKKGELEVRVTGFASRAGDASVNRTISEQRAKNVAWQLANRLGVDSSAIRYDGVGEEMAKVAGRPDGKDNHEDRMALIDISPKVERESTRRLKVSDEQASDVVKRFLAPFPEPEKPSMVKQAREGLFNPLSVLGAAKFGVNGVKNWVESAAAGRRNFDAAANFIPAFLGRTESLTTGSTRSEPLRTDSAAAILGRSAADRHFITLPAGDRAQLTAVMNDERQGPEAMKQIEQDLRRRFIEK